MELKLVMRMPVHTVKPRDSVAHARAVLEELRINQLPVVVNGRLAGIVTDRDLRDANRATQVAANVSGSKAPADPDAIPVEAVMSSNVLTLGPADDIAEAARLMVRERIGSVPIVEARELVGIVTRSDLLRLLASGSERRAGSGNE